MKVLVVRVNKGSIWVKGSIISSIGKGLALFVGIERDDTQATLAAMTEKILTLRIFEDEEGKLNYSVKDKNFQILCIPNFTLCANTDKGRRPSFERSMPRHQASEFYQRFVGILKSTGLEVGEGVFGEHMDISLELDGPVNIVL
jgi:D-tyrosyl-tRNA(Tyr) deacylase